MTAAQFKRTANATSDLTADQESKLLMLIVGFLEADLPDDDKTLGELRDCVAGQVETFISHRQ